MSRVAVLAGDDLTDSDRDLKDDNQDDDQDHDQDQDDDVPRPYKEDIFPADKTFQIRCALLADRKRLIRAATRPSILAEEDPLLPRGRVAASAQM